MASSRAMRMMILSAQDIPLALHAHADRFKLKTIVNLYPGPVIVKMFNGGLVHSPSPGSPVLCTGRNGVGDRGGVPLQKPRPLDGELHFKYLVAALAELLIGLFAVPFHVKFLAVGDARHAPWRFTFPDLPEIFNNSAIHIIFLNFYQNAEGYQLKLWNSENSPFVNCLIGAHVHRPVPDARSPVQVVRPSRCHPTFVCSRIDAR